MLDPTLRKHGGNAASNLAFEHVKPSTQRAREAITDFVWAHRGVTSADITEHLRKMIQHPDNWPPNAVSPRITECKMRKLIMETEELRDGRQVLVRYESQMRLLGECA